MVKRSIVFVAATLALTAPAVWAQTPQEAITAAIAGSDAFAPGTAIVSITVEAPKVVVDLNAEAVAGLTDTQSDAMVKAVGDALGDFSEITDIEVTAAGKALWEYLPRATEGEALPAAPAAQAAPMMMMAMAAAAPASPTSSELAGKMIALHPSHGSYAGTTNWYRAMRTFCGPNPAPPLPPGWTGSTYQPSNYYYWTMGYQWGSFYEDDMSPETIRFLEKYLWSSGAEVWVSRNLDKDAGDFDAVGYGYPAPSFSLPKWQTAVKYYLQDRGDVPEWVWNSNLVSSQSDKDLRARSFYANWRMEQGGYDWRNCLSFSLHSNAAGVGSARGTENFWYTSVYPHLQANAMAYCSAVLTKTLNSIRTQYDGYWAESMYPVGTTRPEFPASSGTYRGYLQDAPSTPASSSGWQSRGVKTQNFAEIRECKMPAQLMELAFHDDWKFYPDFVFMMDQIWRSTVAWGMYEGMCQYWGITPKPRLAASLVSVEAPAQVALGETFTATVTMQNLGQAWCWGNKFDTATKVYGPYTVWQLAPQGDNPLGAAVVQIDPSDTIMPADVKAFTVQLTAPSSCGVYTTNLQMVKNDAKGGVFGEVAAVTVTVGTAPEVVIGSPGPTDYPFGWVDVGYTVTDVCGDVTVAADIDGTPVADGESFWGLSVGAHTLTVMATNTVGTTTKSVTFNVVNTIGKTTAGGWIELADKKGTCGLTCQFDLGGDYPTGSVTYQDHDTGMTVHSEQMIALGIRDNKASMYGTCTIDGESGHWLRVDVVDNGTPGDNDKFDIYLDTGYHAGGTLGGGNIDIH